MHHTDTPQEVRTFSTLFRYSMWWRISYGSIRIFLSLYFFRIIGTPLSEVFTRFVSHELIPDLHDRILFWAHHALAHSSFTVTYFLASYLMFWGLTDVILSICMLKKLLWAFPVSFIFIGLFILYEMHRVSHTHSPILFSIIIIDIIIMYILYREYIILKNKEDVGIV